MDVKAQFRYLVVFYEEGGGGTEQENESIYKKTPFKQRQDLTAALRYSYRFCAFSYNKLHQNKQNLNNITAYDCFYTNVFIQAVIQAQL